MFKQRAHCSRFTAATSLQRTTRRIAHTLDVFDMFKL
jgi:hypothetical protein